MFFLLLKLLTKFKFFTGSYSNNVFLTPLSIEDEDKYLDLMSKGDIDARNKLIEHNLRLVAHIVKKYESDTNFKDDLISIGTIGLIKGIDTYKKDKKIKLTTYCARCIQNEILMFYRTNNKHSKNISINDSIGYDKDGNLITILDILKTDDYDYVDKIVTKDNLNDLNKYLNVLSKREYEIIKLRYGLNNTKEYTQKDIAKLLNISRSYVSRIEKRALIKLFKQYANDQKID